MIGGQPFQTVEGAPTGAVFSGIAGQFLVGTTATDDARHVELRLRERGREDPRLERRVDGRARDRAEQRPVRSTRASRSRTPTPAARGSTRPTSRNARVDVFDGSWHTVNDPGAFVDPHMKHHYAPFGIQTIGDARLRQLREAGPALRRRAARKGRGFVDAYDLHGQLPRAASRSAGSSTHRGASRSAPAGFGRFGGDLLVGNFGDGQINAYEEKDNGHFEHRGTLKDADGKKLAIDGLWALEFGNSGSNGTPNQLFFTAGPNDEADGLFGKINATQLSGSSTSRLVRAFGLARGGPSSIRRPARGPATVSGPRRMSEEPPNRMSMRDRRVQAAILIGFVVVVVAIVVVATRDNSPSGSTAGTSTADIDRESATGRVTTPPLPTVTTTPGQRSRAC